MLAVVAAPNVRLPPSTCRLFLTMVVPVAAPMLTAVAAPPMLRVVAVALAINTVVAPFEPKVLALTVVAFIVVTLAVVIVATLPRLTLPAAT